MGDYVSIADVRRVSGITSTLVDDTDVTATITDIEERVNEYIGTTSVPRRTTEIRDGDGTDNIIVNHLPLLRVVALKIDGVSVTPSNLFVNLDTGFIQLKTDAEVTLFKRNLPQRVALDYFYGLMKNTVTQTTSDGAVTAGNGITLTLTSETGFTNGDWIRITGTDGNQEITKIDALSTKDATVDISYDHVDDSLVTKMDIPQIVKELTGVLAGIKLVARVVGATFDELTGYEIDELRVQKGEPFTQWRETSSQLIKVRDQLLTRLRKMPQFG